MSSLLDNNILPLWVWIIIIVFGSLSIIGTVAFIARCIVVRRRKTAFVDTFGDDNLPQRRVTVRRGRVVPTSNYLSLTGSKFGLNAFLEDGDGNSRAGARSKSPFEWWSTLKERSSSRQSYVTQFTGDGSSIFANATSPQPPQRVYQKREFQQSNASLSTDIKDEDFATTSVVEVEPTPSPPQPPPNFSRSFSSQGHRQDRRQNKLSRIEEASPHTSMISTARQSYVVSFVSSLPARESSASTSSPQAIPTPSENIPLPPSSTSSRQASKRNSMNKGISPMTQMTLPNASHPVALNSARSSLAQPADSKGHSRHSSQRSTRDGNQETRSRSSSFTALPEAREPEKLAGYWETRTDMRPIRQSSKKGNVLRKKSLRRSEIEAKLSS